VNFRGPEELRGLVGFKHFLLDIVTPVGLAEKLDGAYLLALMASTTTVLSKALLLGWISYATNPQVITDFLGKDL
jgi:hypothetical protein